MSRRCSIYINNLPDSCRHEDLRRTFGRYGPIIDVTIPTDYYSGRMKGFAFVEFEDSRDAEYAQRSMDQTRFMGRRIEVEFTRGYRKSKMAWYKLHKYPLAPAEMRDRASRFGRRRSRSGSRQYSRRSRSYSKASDRDRRDYNKRSRSRSSSARNGSSARRMRSNGDFEGRADYRMSPPEAYADGQYRRHQNVRSDSKRSRSAT